MYPVHWSSKVPFRYKKNAINGELHRAKKISSNFQSEIARIKAKFLNAGFPHKVIGSAINNFNNVDDEFMIPRWLFDEKKQMRLTCHSQIKMNIFQKSFARS